MLAYKAYNLLPLDVERFCIYYYIGNKAALLKGTILLTLLKSARVRLNCSVIEFPMDRLTRNHNEINLSARISREITG